MALKNNFVGQCIQYVAPKQKYLLLRTPMVRLYNDDGGTADTFGDHDYRENR